MRRSRIACLSFRACENDRAAATAQLQSTTGAKVSATRRLSWGGNPRGGIAIASAALPDVRPPTVPENRSNAYPFATPRDGCLTLRQTLSRDAVEHTELRTSRRCAKQSSGLKRSTLAAAKSGSAPVSFRVNPSSG
jgi:hypothetical protein